VPPPVRTGPPVSGPPNHEGVPITVSGTVVEGVERGCRLLEDKTGSWLLVGGDPAVARVGAHVRIVGVPSTEHPTTCQQGNPLIVRSVTPF
jgi:hypothetical protein